MNKNEKTEQKNNAAPAYLNRVTLVGFLADKPEQYEAGFAVLRLATKASWKDKTSGEWKSHTDWHRVIAWHPLAEAVKSLNRGDHVMVEGSLRSNAYERIVEVIGVGNGTVTTRSWEIKARAIRKLDRKKAQQPKLKKGGAA